MGPSVAAVLAILEWLAAGRPAGRAHNGDSNPVMAGDGVGSVATLKREFTIEIPRVLLRFTGFRTPSNENPSGRIPIRLGPGRSPAPVQQTRGNVILGAGPGPPGGSR